MLWKFQIVNGRSHNGRFGVMAAVTPRKVQCKFERLCPAGSLVEVATTPSRWDVVRHARETVQVENVSKK